MREEETKLMLSMIFGKKLDEPTIDIWHETFKDYAFDEVKRAVVNLTDYAFCKNPSRFEFKQVLRDGKKEKGRSETQKNEQPDDSRIVHFEWRDQYGDVGLKSERFCYRYAILKR